MYKKFKETNQIAFLLFYSKFYLLTAIVFLI